MDNSEIKILEQLGLRENEAKIYLIMLDTGLSSVLEISKCTEIKRSTIYLIIENLIKKGFVKIVINRKKKIYLTENPNKIYGILKEKKKKLDLIIPDLEKRYNNKSEKPTFVFYEGKEGVRSIYREVAKSKTEILWYGASGDITNTFPEYSDSIYRVNKDNKEFKGMRLLGNNIKVTREYSKLRRREKNSKFKVKVLTGELFFLNSVNVIYDNKLLIISITRDYFAVLIESKTISDVYTCMFELAWKQARYP